MKGENAVCGKVIGGKCVIFEWIAPRHDCPTAIVQTRISIASRRVIPGGTNQTGPVVLCVAFEPQSSPEREKMTVLESDVERERERKSVCTLRDTFMAQSTVYSNIVTPSRKGTWLVQPRRKAFSRRAATFAVLHELLNERKIDLRPSVRRNSSLFYYQREIERGVQFENYIETNLWGRFFWSPTTI